MYFKYLLVSLLLRTYRHTQNQHAHVKKNTRIKNARNTTYPQIITHVLYFAIFIKIIN